MSIVVNDSRLWRRKFIAQLSSHRETAESLRLLRAANMPEGEMLWFVYEYTDPLAVRRQRSLRTKARELADRLIKAGELMKQSMAAVSSLVSDVRLAGTPWESHLEAPAAETLRSAVGHTHRLAEHYKRMSSQKGEARNEEVLVYLCLLIEARTDRPHWLDIANLLELGFLAHGHSESWDADKLRKIVKRFRSDYPEVYKEMRDFILREHGPSEQTTTPGRSTRNRRGKL
jgi:hypothetical protein